MKLLKTLGRIWKRFKKTVPGPLPGRPLLSHQVCQTGTKGSTRSFGGRIVPTREQS